MATVGESSSAPSVFADDKPVVVRVKRKPSQSPVDAFWLEINERPLKRPLLDFGNLSLSDSAHKEEFNIKKVLVQHVETISSSDVTFNIVQSFVEPGSNGGSEYKSKVEERKHLFKKENKQDQLLFKAKQKQESLAKNARFEQIWKSRKENKEAVHEKALQEICRFYDVVRVDKEEKPEEVQQEDISLEDQRLLSSYLPLLREFIPNAATEIECDFVAHSKKEDYVYDFYTVTDGMDINVEDSSYSYPLVQVDDEDFCDGPDESDYETDDSNAENNPLNDYPDEISSNEEENEEGSEVSESESEEDEYENASNVSSGDKDLYHGAFSLDDDDDADPLYDDDFDDDCGVNNDGADDEDWRWSYR
ncbi:hypothetical protein L6164_005078 [Bauhinia variegata]|uniref:Uncharacterized protein n=1 Tax=Bauhinia variegata TaxID=167791 RepID=A0ACB9PSB8_BAUVA|nr:hypothetical protein L6164_005078 [Bauhinia variegata]